MFYLEITTISFIVLWIALTILTAHYFFFTLIGIFRKKRYIKTEKKLRYAVVIGARNEARVIGRLLDSIFQAEYPKEKLSVFVCAHNCTDETASIAREKGGTVYEYNNENERTVGYAYRYVFEKIKEDFGLENFDGFFIINADNVVKKEYFDKMNDAFVENDGGRVITSCRNSVNFGENYMSYLYGMFFLSACRYESRGRTVCGCSTRVSGTGYLFPSRIVKDGWPYVTLTEDWEFTADQVLAGEKVLYCDDAEFFDEQPTTIPVMLRQRLRWARGHTMVFFSHFLRLIRSLFLPRKQGGKDNKYSAFDCAVSIMPLGAIGVSIALLQTLCVLLVPLFSEGEQVWDFFWQAGVSSFIISYLLTVFSGILLLILERKRVPKANFFKKFLAVLLWPFFLFLNVLLDVASFFVKNLEWKVIPHKGNDTKEK